MNQQPLEFARDADLRHSLVALQRAALRARNLAAQTGTQLIISRDGLVQMLDPDPSDKESLFSKLGTSPSAALEK